MEAVSIRFAMLGQLVFEAYCLYFLQAWTEQQLIPFLEQLVQLILFLEQHSLE